MKNRLLLLLILFFLLYFGLSIVPSSNISAQETPRNAIATLYNPDGTIVGNVSFAQSAGFVSVIAQVHSLPAGFHALQIHIAGICDRNASPPFSTAGLPFDPNESVHPNQAADLPVLLVLQNGSGYMSTITDRFTLANLLDADGSAVVIHANPSNYANIPPRYGAADAESQVSGDAGDAIACGTVQSVEAATAARANLAAFEALPLELLPASVSREEGAEHGTLVLTLPELGGIQVVSEVTSGAAGQIGEVHQEGDFLVFTFTEITYDVAPIELPGGLLIGPQTIRLDPNQTSTLRESLITGEIFRDFHWIQTATDVLYDGQPSINLGDTASAQVGEVVHLGGNRYSVRLLTQWRSSITLETWTIGGVTLPSGQIDATAEFDGVYILDFDA